MELCYTDTDSFIVHIKTKDFYEDINNDVEEWFDTSNYKTDRPLLMTDKNKKVLGKFKDELGGRIMTKFVGLRSKTYAYLIDDFEKKRNNGVKKCVVENDFKFSYYTDCLFNNNVILKSQQKFISKMHNVYTEEVNKISLRSNDEKKDYGLLKKYIISSWV